MKSPFDYFARVLPTLAGCLLVLPSAILPIPAFGSHPDDARPAYPVAQEFTKSIQREFPIRPDGTVSLHNRHGKTDIRTWSKPVVRIEVAIRVEARSATDAEDVFDRIDIEFSNNPASVRAETVIQSSYTWFSWGGNNDKYQIDYLVHLPATVDLELGHQYGDVFAEPLQRNADVSVKYGNIRLEGVGQELRLQLSYGSGTVVSAGYVDADLAYGKLYLNQVDRTNLLTRYSKIFIDRAMEVRLDSRYDQFEVGPIETLDCNARYGNLELESVATVRCKANYTDIVLRKLTASGDFDMEYGGLRILRLADRFSELLLDGRYTDFRVAVDADAAYALTAACNFADLRYPSDLHLTLDQRRNTSREVKGYSRNQHAGSRINATVSYGGLRLTVADR